MPHPSYNFIHTNIQLCLWDKISCASLPKPLGGGVAYFMLSVLLFLESFLL